jgi:hypothetical protein
MQPMTRAYLIAYLATVDCYPANGKDVPEVSQILRNHVNGLTAFVPCQESLSLITYCRIFYELKVDPPIEYGYDSDYAVFSSFMN